MRRRAPPATVDAIPVTRRNIMRTWFAAAAVAVSITLGLALNACGSSGHPAGGSVGHTPSDSGRSAIEAVVACYRAHGDPGFPDPVYDPGDGRWHFAVSRAAVPESTQQACQRLTPASTASPPVPQAQFQALVRLAECLRQHGLPTWPDPRPDGAFPISSPVLVKSPAGRNSMKACRRFIPSGGLDVVAAP
jgi:hypothetical protein